MIDADRRTLQRIKRLEDRLALVRRTAAGKDPTPYQPLDDELSALAALKSAMDQLPYFTGPGSAALTELTGSGRSLLGLDGTANQLPYYPTDGQAALTPLTPFARTLIDDSTALAARTTLGVESLLSEALGQNYFVEDYGAVNDGKQVFDGVMGLDNQLYSGNAAFTAADVGKRVAVYGATADDAPQIPLRTTIVSVSGGNAYLAAAAATAVTDAIVVWGSDNTAAIQACLDDALDADVDAVVKLKNAVWNANRYDALLDKTGTYEGFYLVESPPRHDRHGNCILSIDDALASHKRLAIVGNSDAVRGGDNPMPIIRTTRYEQGLLSGISSGLSAQLTAGDTTLSLDDVTDFPDTGAVIIEQETITYTGRDTGADTLTGLTRGVNGMDVTHVDTMSAYHTYGPPSLLGGRTWENGAVPGFEYTGLISVLNVKFVIGGDPRLGGIDAISWGGLDCSAVVLGSGGGLGAIYGPPDVDNPRGTLQPASNNHAFGIRTPSGANYGYNRLRFSGVSAMYAAYVFTSCDHMTFVHAHCSRCVLAFGFQSPIDRRHTIGGGYTVSEYNNYHLAGWSPILGVHSLPFASGLDARPAHITDWIIDMEEASAPFDCTAVIQDDNDMIHGDVKFHWNLSESAALPGPVNGAANLRIETVTGSRDGLDWQDWTPTPTGWSPNPSNTVYRYHQVGKKVTMAIRQQTAGTSNLTTKSLTLPVTAATITNMTWEAPVTFVNGGTLSTTPGMAAITSAGTAVLFFTDWASNTWTASGACRIVACTMTYEAA